MHRPRTTSATTRVQSVGRDASAVPGLADTTPVPFALPPMKPETKTARAVPHVAKPAALGTTRVEVQLAKDVDSEKIRNTTVTLPAPPSSARVLFSPLPDLSHTPQSNSSLALQRKANQLNLILSDKDDKFAAVVKLNAELQAQLNDLLRVNELLRIDAELQRRENATHQETQAKLAQSTQQVEQQTTQIRELEHAMRTLQDEVSRLSQENKRLLESVSNAKEEAERSAQEKLVSYEAEISSLRQELRRITGQDSGECGTAGGLGETGAGTENEDNEESHSGTPTPAGGLAGASLGGGLSAHGAPASPASLKSRNLGNAQQTDASDTGVAAAAQIRALKQELQELRATAVLLKAERDRLAEAHRSCGLNAIELVALKKELADNRQLREIIEELRLVAEERTEEAARLRKQEQRLEAAIMSRRTEIAEIKNQVMAAQVAQNEAETALAALRETHATTAAKLEATEKSLQAVREEWSSERTRMNSEISALKQQVNTLTADKRTLESTLKATEEVRQALQAERAARWEEEDARVQRMTKMAQQLKASRDEVGELSETINGLKSTISGLERQLEQANAARKRADGEIAAQRLRADAAEAKYAELLEQSESNQLTVSRQLRQIETLQNKLDSLGKSYHRQQEEIRILQAKVESNTGLRAQYDETKASLDKLLEAHEIQSHDLRNVSKSLAQATEDARKYQQLAAEATAREAALQEKYNTLKRQAAEKADKYEKLKEDYLRCVSDLRASQRSLTLSNLGDAETRQQLAIANASADEARASLQEAMTREKKLKTQLADAKSELREVQLGAARLLFLLASLVEVHELLTKAPEHHATRKIQNIAAKLCDETVQLLPPDRLPWRGKLASFAEPLPQDPNAPELTPRARWIQQNQRWQQGGMFEPLPHPPTLPPSLLCSIVSFATVRGYGPSGTGERKYELATASNTNGLELKLSPRQERFQRFDSDASATDSNSGKLVTFTRDISAQPILHHGLVLTPARAISSLQFQRIVSEVVRDHIEWCLQAVQTKSKLQVGIETALTGYERISRLYAECPKEDWTVQAQDLTRELNRTNKALSSLAVVNEGSYVKLSGLDEACVALEVLDQTLAAARATTSKQKQETEKELRDMAQARARELAGLSSATGKAFVDKIDSIERMVAASFARDRSPLTPLNLAINDMALVLHRTLRSVQTLATSIRELNESLVHAASSVGRAGSGQHSVDSSSAAQGEDEDDLVEESEGEAEQAGDDEQASDTKSNSSHEAGSSKAAQTSSDESSGGTDAEKQATSTALVPAEPRKLANYQSKSKRKKPISLRVPSGVFTKSIPDVLDAMQSLETEHPLWHPLTAEIRHLATFLRDTIGAHSRVTNSLAGVADDLLGVLTNVEAMQNRGTGKSSATDETNAVVQNPESTSADSLLTLVVPNTPTVTARELMDKLVEGRRECIDRLREELFEIASYSKRGIWLSPLVRQVVLLIRRLMEVDDTIRLHACTDAVSAAAASSQAAWSRVLRHSRPTSADSTQSEDADSSSGGGALNTNGSGSSGFGLTGNGLGSASAGSTAGSPLGPLSSVTHSPRPTTSQNQV